MRSRRVTLCRPVGGKRGHCSDAPDSGGAAARGVRLGQSEMVEAGVALIVVGAALLVVEAHVPGGVLGAAGGIALAGGAVLGALAATGLWLAFATRKALATRRLRSPSGREALAGRAGVVRSWRNGDGQVFVDGALWRARPSWPDSEEQLAAGDAVVVERVTGLTLGVRKAEEWEEI